MAKPDRKSTSFTIREDLIERLDKEADDRMVGRNLLVERALEGYLDLLVPVDLPTAADVAGNAKRPTGEIE